MLVLTRKVHQDLYIADDLIRVVVLGVDGNRVRLGIAAPKDITIIRGEAFRRQQQTTMEETPAIGVDGFVPVAAAAAESVEVPAAVER